MRLKALAATLVLLLSAGLFAADAGARADQDKNKDKKKKEEPKTEAKEEAKAFQLDMIYVDVTEKARDVKVPNMTVVKPVLFPMNIGTTVDTALERQAGVDVQRIQEVGTAVDDDSIKIRGLGSRRIKVLKDGRPLNGPGAAGGYFIDWTMIPLTNVDRVEVIKGVGDARYGNVLGGVVNLVTRSLPTDRPTTELEMSGGSYDTAGFNLYHGYKPGAFEYSLAANGYTSDGYLKNGTVRSGNADLHLGYDFSFKGRLTADVSYSELKKGFIVGNRVAGDPDDPGYYEAVDPDYPASDGEYMYGGMGAYAEDGSWWKKKRLMFSTGYRQAIGDSGVLDVYYWKNHGDREAYNTRESLDRIFHKMFYEDRSEGYGAAYTRKLGASSLEAGFEYSFLHDGGSKTLDDDFRGESELGYYTGVHDLEGYVTTDVSFGGGRYILTPGVRVMSWRGVAGPAGIDEGIPNVDMSGVSPSLKFTWVIGGDDSLYASISRAVRMPSVPEYFWHYDYDAGVDTSAIPFRHEDGLMVQAGWRTSLPDGTHLEISPYFYDILHYIQFDLINFVAYNIDRAEIYGLEVEATRPLGRCWTAFANYTYQQSRTWGDEFKELFLNADSQDFDQVPGLPPHKANLGLQYKTRKKLSIAGFAQFVSRRKVLYDDNTLYNTDLTVRTQGAYVRLDAEARWPVMNRLDVGLFVRNLTGVNYQERYGFPAAGRNIGLSLKTWI